MRNNKINKFAGHIRNRLTVKGFEVNFGPPGPGLHRKELDLATHIWYMYNYDIYVSSQSMLKELGFDQKMDALQVTGFV